MSKVKIVKHVIALLVIASVLVVAALSFEYNTRPLVCQADVCEPDGGVLVWSSGLGKTFVKTTPAGPAYRETISGLFFKASGSTLARLCKLALFGLYAVFSVVAAIYILLRRSRE